jgi:phosphoribosylanthranilate isomerase
MIVKIEGITNEDDALLAVAMGANMIGFVFAPSPRQIAPQRAADIAKRLPTDEAWPVGVFRDEAPERVVEIARRTGMRAVQLHGNETPQQTRWIRKHVPAVIKAFPAGDLRVSRAGDYGADVILLDSPSPGSGRVFDWALAAEVPAGQRFMIAGGLTPDNVAGAVVRTQPWGVDVASGVESSPGVKDPVKLRAFIAAARAAAPPEVVDDDPTGGLGLYDWAEEP